MIRNRDLSKVEPFDHAEDHRVRHALLVRVRDGDGAGLHPADGETKPHYTGPKPPYERLDTDGKYTWLKSPRYDGLPMEVGPLARMLVAYAVGPPAREGAGGRGAREAGRRPRGALLDARAAWPRAAIETQVLAERIDGWLDELAANMARGDLRIHDNSKWDPDTWPTDAQGCGLPRGAARGARPLGPHQDGAIENYQCVVPAPGTRARATPTGSAGPTRRR